METTVTDTRPQFSRITEGSKRHSWRAAVPAVVVLVIFLGLIAYLVSSVSSYSQRASTAERDANQYRDQVAAMGKQVGDLQKDVSLARSPGRTTVIVEAAQPAKKGAAPATNRSWAANGSGFAMKADLPGVDQGKAVMLTIDAHDAKQPGEVVAKADLPKLQPTMTGAAPQAQDTQQTPASESKAKAGTDTQQMHQTGK
ncbi:MAG: hypothetical protein E6J84_13450 [Deltaproteobacteria bacterium]|nr:MAG: hypothetical protein E6J84_13450 [Deltaproteobacteria bacterium]